MKTKNDGKLKIWELSLLFALCVSLCCALWAHAGQTELSSQLVRLHVIAESDSDEDQAVKLKVRDAVLEYLVPKLKTASSVSAASGIITDSLPDLDETAEKVLSAEGHEVSAAATLSVESYPTRVYDGFALPAGEYLSLRIVLGEGRGHNWWCVVFPPLCMSAAEDEDAFSALSGEAQKLILSDDGGYTLKFRIIEWYELLRAALRK
ncbi:MAG: stage II sporulation protein R [Clostridia bacterium]|nr:stage II sporulation protein R [Clostridia bacterium]